MNEANECVTCGKKLIDKKSIDRGYGPVCYQKHLKAVEDAEIERNQITVYEAIEGVSL